MLPSLSIIIPTHKRPQILRQCLQHIERQTIADQVEVIIVSDGPDAHTKRVVGTLHSTPAVRYFEIPKRQQGTARNFGVKHARAPYVLFIGDDIFLAPDACEKHLKTLHSRFSDLRFAVLGFTTWDPACKITPVMKWLERSGWQFGYPMIKRHAHHFLPSHLQHRFTYTSHISLPTKIAKRFPFREDITTYGWEDIEWGLRLKNAGLPAEAPGAKAGVKLLYEPDAKALHHHHITLTDSLKRMQTLGKSAVVMDRLVPQLRLVPRGWRLWKYRIAAMLPTMPGRHAKALIS